MISPRIPARLLCLTLALLISAAWSASAGAGDWPQFRGPNCSGLAASNEPLPLEFGPEKNQAWSAEVGEGIGSPVVADGRVAIAGMLDEETVGLSCFDAASGKLLWKKELATGPLPEIHKTNSHAATTAAIDSQRVYFYFSTLGMRAYDAKTGKPVWERELPVPYFVFKWGAGMSPVLFEDKLIFCQDDDLNPAIYAFDKKTGEILWKSQRDEMAVNYSHPVICQSESGPELVVAGTGKLIGYDPHTGKQLWQARVLLRNIKTTPVCHDGVVYVSLQSGGIANQWLATADDNSDGKLTKEEIQNFVGEVKVPEAFWKKFERGDSDGDGFLVGEELDRAFLDPDNFAGARYDQADPSDQFILAVRGGGRGDVTSSHVLWKHESRAPDHICSPLVSGNRMFVVKGGGISSCFDIQNGQPLWSQKRIQNIGDYFASPVAGDGKIYVAGENGTVVVLEDGPELKVLAKNDVGDSILGTPALADGRIYIRSRSKLMCFEKDK